MPVKKFAARSRGGGQIGRRVRSFFETNCAAPSLLAAHPLIGKIALGAPASSGIHFLLLRGSRFLLYYSVHEEDVEVLRFWHTSRSTRPYSD